DDDDDGDDDDDDAYADSDSELVFNLEEESGSDYSQEEFADEDYPDRDADEDEASAAAAAANWNDGGGHKQRADNKDTGADAIDNKYAYKYDKYKLSDRVLTHFQPIHIKRLAIALTVWRGWHLHSFVRLFKDELTKVQMFVDAINAAKDDDDDDDEEE